jgi:hypothetical protein
MPMSPQLLAARKLDTAATTSRITGVACLVLAGLSLIPVVGAFAYASTTLLLIYFVGLTLDFVGPAVGYLLLAPRIKAGRRWALITTLVIASLQLLLLTVAIIRGIMNNAIAGLLIASILALLLILLIVHLSKCFSVLNHLATPRGFEPLMASPPAGQRSAPPIDLRSTKSDWPDIR